MPYSKWGLTKIDSRQNGGTGRNNLNIERGYWYQYNSKVARKAKAIDASTLQSQEHEISKRPVVRESEQGLPFQQNCQRKSNAMPANESRLEVSAV